MRHHVFEYQPRLPFICWRCLQIEQADRALDQIGELLTTFPENDNSDEHASREYYQNRINELLDAPCECWAKIGEHEHKQEKSR